MNREYGSMASIHSNTGIYEAFYAEIGRPHQSVLYGLRARLFAWFRAGWMFLCSAAVRRVSRVAVAAGALVGLVGVAGSLECGRLSPVVSLLLAAGLLFLAYLAMRPHRRNSNCRKAS